MILVALYVITLGDIYQCAVLGLDTHSLTIAQTALHLLEHAVRYGTYGAHRLHHYVMRHAYIEVCLGTHHLVLAAGGDIFIHVHGV